MKQHSTKDFETFSQYRKGVDIACNPSLPAELRLIILGYCHKGPLSYSTTEDNKARDRAAYEAKKRGYTPG